MLNQEKRSLILLEQTTKTIYEKFPLLSFIIDLFTIQAHEFDFSELVKDQSESVVNIQSVRKVKVITKIHELFSRGII